MKRYTRKNKIRRNKTIKKRVFTDEDFKSNNGFNTAIWGSCMWLFLHTISFNYPVKPTEDVKNNYKSFILNLQNILPCKICRENLKNNFKTLPLKDSDLENRDAFSRYIYSLHELINTMLEKKSGLTYEMVRERFEHFRGISKNTLKNNIISDEIKGIDLITWINLKKNGKYNRNCYRTDVMKSIIVNDDDDIKLLSDDDIKTFYQVGNIYFIDYEDKE